MRVMIAAFVCLSIVSGGEALAGPAEARACADALSAESRMIYDAAAPEVKPGEKPAGVIRAKTRGLVMSGKLARDGAQAKAEAAGACLLKLHDGS
ncbi:MAG: hypothetical protein KGS00_13105 [Alphaproteobacteria bacterium]|nr:hypothetical protein [Alphaproteobacteria bacterium]